MKSRNIKRINIRINDLYDEELDIRVFIDDPNESYVDDEESKLGNYGFFYSTIEDGTEYGRIKTIYITNYKEALKTKFADTLDCGLLNFEGYGYDLKNMTLKDILVEIFINTDGERILLEEFNED